MGELKRKGMLLTILTGIIIGFMAGAVAVNALVSFRMDMYHQQIKYLERVIDEKNIKLEKFEESINKKRYILKDVEIILLYEEDGIDKITLEKNIKEKYSMLIGKEVKTIDPDLLVEIVDKRIMIIKDKKYKLKLSRLMLAEVLKIWIEVKVE